MTTVEQESFAELHDELTAVARELLGSAAPDRVVDWGLISRSGWLGLEVADSLDGAGATFAEVAVILREIGRATARGPYPAVAGIAVGLLNLLAPGPGRDRLLAATAAGDTVSAVVFTGHGLGQSSFELVATSAGQGLRGSAEFALDTPTADRLLIPAIGPDGTTVVVDLDARTSGLLIENQPVVDETRSFGRVVAENIVLPSDSVLRFDGDPQRSLQRVQDRAAVAVACDSLGLAEAMLDTTVAYVGVREQFDRKIGSFQAVKHACADMLAQITIARTLVAAAVDALSDPNTETSTAAAMAKSFTGTIAVETAGKAMQLHGGMGYTWESGIHVYLKRATLNRSLFGSPAAHRKKLAERY